MSRLVPLSLALLLSLSLAGCGKRGPLEPPPGNGPATAAEKADAKAAQAAAPKEKTAAPKEKTAQASTDPNTDADANGGQPGRTRLGGKKRVPITPPKRDLIIDGILE